MNGMSMIFPGMDPYLEDPRLRYGLGKRMVRCMPEQPHRRRLNSSWSSNRHRLHEPLRQPLHAIAAANDPLLRRRIWRSARLPR